MTAYKTLKKFVSVNQSIKRTILTKMDNIGFTRSHLAWGVHETQWKQLKPLWKLREKCLRLCKIMNKESGESASLQNLSTVICNWGVIYKREWNKLSKTGQPMQGSVVKTREIEGKSQERKLFICTCPRRYSKSSLHFVYRKRQGKWACHSFRHHFVTQSFLKRAALFYFEQIIID